MSSAQSMPSQDPSWEALAGEFERLTSFGPFYATWFAYQDSEDYGVWFLLGARASELEQLRSRFSVLAAHAICKCGVQPLPIPKPTEHCPDWKKLCEAEEEFAQLRGQPVDYSEAVPHGLRTIDVDAVDPCSRTWLEWLRRESAGFRISAHGDESIKGITYGTVGGVIDNLLAASAVYARRRARDQISGLSAAKGGSSNTIAGVTAARDGAHANAPSCRCPKDFVNAARRRMSVSHVQWAARIGVGKDTLYAITQETRWVSDDTYSLVAQACSCKPEDLHPRDLPRRQRHAD